VRAGEGSALVGAIQDVVTGEVAVSRMSCLRANALGSCVAVALHDAAARLGGLAHVMLPGSAPPGSDVPATRYAENALRALLEVLEAQGGEARRISAALAGGGNVLGPGQEGIGQDIVASVLRCLAEMGIRVVASDVGGSERRSLWLESQTGRIFFTVGDSGPMLLRDPGLEGRGKGYPNDREYQGGSPGEDPGSRG